ncbi:MAG: FAD-dependent thymidylate synthase [Candidatus Woesearchaeota archaeon]
MVRDIHQELREVAAKLRIDPDQYSTGTLTSLIRTAYRAEEYAPDEATFLSHFFTNLDRNVYAVNPGRIPDELLALNIGSFSRSELSGRDRLLAVFGEMEERKRKLEGEGRTFEGYVPLAEVAREIRANPGISLEFFLDKARAFHERYVIGYGHASIAEGDMIRIYTEGVSQLATKFLESAVLGAYQEKSTRYVSFEKNALVVPPTLRYSEEFSRRIDTFHQKIMEDYAASNVEVRSFLEEKVFKRENFEKKAVYESTVRAKMLDITRYFLPLSVQTSLGMTMSARTLRDHISFLLSQPLEEVQLIGYNMLVEGLMVSPSLLSHIDVNQHTVKRDIRMQDLAQELGFQSEQSPVAGREKNAVHLISPVEFPENYLAAAFLAEYSNQRFSEILSRVRTLPPTAKEHIFDAYLKDRGAHDAMGKAAELGLLVFDLVLDNGAFRDLARHRKGTILRQRFSPEHGFELPEFIEEPELSFVKERYERAMEYSYSIWKDVAFQMPEQAQYLALMGHKVQYTYAADPRQMAYLIPLRTQEGGHHSYRTLTQEMFREMQRVLPTFAKHVRANMESGTSRQKAEERAAVKREIV